MRTKFFILSLVLALSACRNNEKSGGGEEELAIDESTQLAWEVDYDHKSITKNELFLDEDRNPDTLVNRLNRIYSQIQLRKLKLGSDTLYLEIKNAEYLTEDMGTYGANAYISAAVINLTSVTGVNYVNIYFEDGTHLSHGTWSKSEFDNFKRLLP